MAGTRGHRGLWLRILCAFALVCLSFAHRPVAFDAFAQKQDFAAYVLPDGKLPVICITVQDGDDTKQESGKTNGCEACRLAAAANVPARIVLPEPTLRPVRQAIIVVRPTLFTRKILPPNAVPRAPPAPSMIA